MKKTVALLPGDGIGPEVMEEAVRVLRRIEEVFGHKFELRQALVGGAAYTVYGSHFPAETKKVCETSDAILFGSVGGPVAEQHLPQWKNCEATSLLAIRKGFELSVNYRPVYVYPQLAEISPLKSNLLADGLDILFIRELVGDLYFGEKKLVRENGRRVAIDVATYSEDQIAVAAHAAFRSARLRRKKVTSVDKANVLETSRLWRAVVKEIGTSYPDVSVEDMLVDNCAMQLIKNPSQFDVLLTSNMFGDILSDAAAVLPGSLGLLPSASMNTSGFGMFEPSGGSAPDIAGKGIANPAGQILSVALMLRFAFSLDTEAKAIEAAVASAIGDGARTSDLLLGGPQGACTTREFTDAVLSQLTTVVVA